MTAPIRLLLLLFAVPATFYFVYWVPSTILGLHEIPFAAPLASVAAAAFAGRYVWGKSAPGEGGLVGYILLGALIVGSVGFVGGFFGPMFLAPGANQGPMLGLFITGPAGFLIGAVGGFLFGLRARGR